MGWFLDKMAQNFAVWLPELLAACLQTLYLTAAAFLIAIVCGMAIALLRISGVVILGVAVMLVTVVAIASTRGLPSVLPALEFDSFTAAAIGLGLQGAAILAEIFRAGIEALDRGQGEASLSLGLTPRQAMGYVILPQAIRIVLPPVGNYAIGLLKDTSIASIIAAPDLMLRAKDIASSSFLPMHLYVLAAILYFAMSYPLSLLMRRLERRLNFRSSPA